MKMFGAEKYLAPIVSRVFDTPIAILTSIFGKRQVYSKCPKCTTSIRFPQEKCTSCRVELDWNKNVEWNN